MNSPIKMQGRVTAKAVDPTYLSKNASEDEEGMGLEHATPGTLAKKTK